MIFIIILVSGIAKKNGFDKPLTPLPIPAISPKQQLRGNSISPLSLSDLTIRCGSLYSGTQKFYQVLKYDTVKKT